MTSGIYQRTAPRVQVRRGYWGNEPYARTTSAPVTADVTIQSGQLISLTSGKWVLGCAAGKEPFIAFHDSADSDVVSAGQLVGLSCAGQFEIETGFFNNAATYVEGSQLMADVTGGSGVYQTAGNLGQVTLLTSATAGDTIGFACGGGRQDSVATDSSAAPISGHLYVLRFRTHWLPRASTAS